MVLLVLKQRSSPPLRLQFSTRSNLRITCDDQSTAACFSEYIIIIIIMLAANTNRL
jgi:hypothetical protein